jgi:hypothetical protein
MWSTHDSPAEGAADSRGVGHARPNDDSTRLWIHRSEQRRPDMDGALQELPRWRVGQGECRWCTIAPYQLPTIAQFLTPPPAETFLAPFRQDKTE